MRGRSRRYEPIDDQRPDDGTLSPCAMSSRRDNQFLRGADRGGEVEARLAITDLVEAAVFAQWSVGTAEDAPRALFEHHMVDPVEDIWLWKPALTSAAAAMVAGWMMSGRKPSPVGDGGGTCVYMFKKASEAADEGGPSR